MHEGHEELEEHLKQDWGSILASHSSSLSALWVSLRAQRLCERLLWLFRFMTHMLLVVAAIGTVALSTSPRERARL